MARAMRMARMILRVLLQKLDRKRAWKVGYAQSTRFHVSGGCGDLRVVVYVMGLFSGSMLALPGGLKVAVPISDLFFTH